MTVTASACSTENREQLQTVQELPSVVDAAIVAPCVEPHRTVEADQISDDLKELVGWWRRSDVHPRQPRHLKRLPVFIVMVKRCSKSWSAAASSSSGKWPATGSNWVTSRRQKRPLAVLSRGPVKDCVPVVPPSSFQKTLVAQLVSMQIWQTNQCTGLPWVSPKRRITRSNLPVLSAVPSDPRTHKSPPLPVAMLISSLTWLMAFPNTGVKWESLPDSANTACAPRSWCNDPACLRLIVIAVGV